MRPRVVEILNDWFDTGVFTYLVPNYWILLAAAACLGPLFAVRQARRLSLDPDVFYGVALWTFPSAIAGARLFHWLRFPESYASPLAIFDPLAGGMVAYGGFIAATAAAIGYFHHRRVDIWRYADLGAAGVGIGTAVTRAGCFLDGCDFGTVTDSWVGVQFPTGSPAFEQHLESQLIPVTATASLGVHPVQLYLSLNGLVLAAVTTYWAKSRRGRSGEAFFLYWGLYALTRFALEFLRGDAGRGFVGPLSTSQAVSLPVLAGAAVGFWWRHREGAREAHPGALGDAAAPEEEAPEEAAPEEEAPEPAASGERTLPIEVTCVTLLAAAAVRLHLAAGALWASLSPAVWIYLPLLVLALRRRPLAGHGYDFASWRRGSRWLFLSMALVLVPVGLVIVLFRLATGAPVGLDPAATALIDLPIEFLWIVVPEELFFRGYVQGRWSAWARKRGAAMPWAPVVFTAALFATAHLLVRADPISTAVFFPGLVMSWLRERSGGLLAPAGFHLAANLLWRSLGY